MVVFLFIFLSLLFWVIAAFLNAVMDTLVHHYWHSIFNSRKLDDKFWNPAISWQTTPYLPYTKYKADAWHIAKSLMIISQALSCCFIFIVGVYILPETPAWLLSIDSVIIMIVLGLLWNGVFNLFYNKILIKKQK